MITCRSFDEWLASDDYLIIWSVYWRWLKRSKREGD